MFLPDKKLVYTVGFLKRENRKWEYFTLSSNKTICKLKKFLEDNDIFTENNCNFNKEFLSKKNFNIYAENFKKYKHLGDLFFLMDEAIKKRFEFKTKKERHIIILWIIGTYFYQIFNAYPYLYFHGKSGSGKSELLKLIGLLSFNGNFLTDYTEAALYRKISNMGCTLCLDEVEKIIIKKGGCAILNAGYKNTGLVARANADFYSYSPKAFASNATHSIDGTFMSRCIKIPINKLNIKNKNLILISEDDEITELRDSMFFYTLNNIDNIHETLQSILEIGDRSNEMWLPLKVLAKIIDKETDLKITNELIEEIEHIEKQDQVELVNSVNEFTVCYVLLQSITNRIDKEDVCNTYTEISDLIDKHFPEAWDNTGYFQSQYEKNRFIGKIISQLSLAKFSKSKRYGDEVRRVIYIKKDTILRIIEENGWGELISDVTE